MRDAGQLTCALLKQYRNPFAHFLHELRRKGRVASTLIDYLAQFVADILDRYGLAANRHQAVRVPSCLEGHAPHELGSNTLDERRRMAGRICIRSDDAAAELGQKCRVSLLINKTTGDGRTDFA